MPDEARNICQQHDNMKFIETSSVAKTNVNEAFETLLHDIYSQRQNIPKSSANHSNQNLKIYEEDTTQQNSGCCWMFSKLISYAN